MKQTLIFMTHTARYAGQYGFKSAVAKAGARVNPALMVLEAAGAVLEAVNSYINLKNAEAHRDGLKKTLSSESNRLAIQRQELALILESAKRDIERQADINRRISELVIACAISCKGAFEELLHIRQSDLPDLDAFDRVYEQLEEAHDHLRQALSNLSQDDEE
ncbi:hypothetical protein [Pseudomonas nunensis]|uniref:Uncharacterized protein n=1 Tax=Pseudomonas nunensis TaxID=2961896 RepID=A0ABY5E8N8_9PSED|nr:hypothetical protein [Pseudomonas nunensis]KPN91534.1 hypothetical protein AL066_14760 [Pseudomonas nunensis]MCL5229783.1 hypothetical protein [Pseudomonas nunensis]UTO11732.1 hypothetical protein NK667_16155 [Pseudomonas nunensis]